MIIVPPPVCDLGIVDFDRNYTLKSTEIDYASVCKVLEQKDISFGAIHEPIKDNPPTFTFPVYKQGQPNSNRICSIKHHSLLKDFSLKDCIHNFRSITDVTLHYPSLHHFKEILCILNSYPLLYNINIGSVFHYLKVDGSILFESRHGSVFFYHVHCLS